VNKFIDILIESYTVKRKRKQLERKEIEEFMRFFFSLTETDDKYKQMQTSGLNYIDENRKQIYKKISEAVPNIHNRSKDYQSILRSEAARIGR
tara:strand:- start:1166 stop:1444 length:279 start_codon:yes stop_codon:yes gene_type:complete